MGFYTDVLIKRENIDNKLAKSADEALKNNSVNYDSVANTENVRKAVEEILKRLRITPREVRSCNTAEDVLNAMLDPVNILYEKVDMNDKAWRGQSNLMLVFTEDGVPLVLSPFVVGYRYFQPTTLQRGIVFPWMKFKKEGYIIYRPLEGDNFSIKNFFKLMLHLVSPRDIFVIAAATLAVSLLGLVAPSVNKQVLTRVVNEGAGAIPYLWISAFVFIVAGLTKGFFSVIKTFLLGNMKQRISTQMQTAIMAKLLLMPYEFFETGGSGKLSNQIRNGSRLSDMLIDLVMNSMLNTVFSLVYIPQMFSLAPQLVLPACTILVIQMVLSVMLTLLSAEHTSMKIALQQETDSYFFEALKGMQKIKNMGAEKRVYARVAENYGAVLTAELLPPVYIRLKDSINTFISTMGAAIVLIIAASGSVAQEDYIAFTASYGLLAGSVTTLVSMCNNIVSMKPLHEQLRNLFSYSGVEEGVEFVNEIKGNIEVENLCYSYNKGEKGCV
ncbi:MAG: hypothetical protein K6F00_10180, partial [Lachnospiraceae bacterium]|nr:hypothetical protein [Lachnospiraceae bacterium]